MTERIVLPGNQHNRQLSALILTCEIGVEMTIEDLQK